MVHRPGALVSQLNFLVHETLRRRGVALPQAQMEVRIREASGPALEPSRRSAG